jgi:hypothetical protein
MNTFTLRKLVLILGLLVFSAGLFAQVGEETKSENQQLEALGLSASSTSDEWIAVYFEQEAQYLNLNNRQVTTAGKEILDLISRKVQEFAPGTFASYYIPYHELVPSSSTKSLLDQASAAEPNNSLVFDDYVAQGELNRDASMKKKYSKKLEAASVYSLPTMEYNLNVLNSLPTNAFLITYGNDDTYPLWIWQEVFNTATTVTVINVDLLAHADYRKNICQRLNIADFNAIELDAEARIDKLLGSSNGNIYLALTIAPNILKNHSKDLYLTGLALHYSDGSISNLAALASNWENRFARSYIELNEPINRNYDLMFSVLADYYEDSNNQQMLQELENLRSDKQVKKAKTSSKKRPAAY